MQRIAILGAGGSGKTTLARHLSAALRLPATHLDALRYHPDWTLVPEDEFVEAQQRLLATDSWIIVPLTEPNLTFPQLSDRFGSRSFCLS